MIQIRQHSDIPLIAVCLATYKRPVLLDELLNSLACIDKIRGTMLELRVIDNDSSGSARICVEKFQRMSSAFDTVRYDIEPRQNIALARNAALDLGPADIVVFVDDDETVGKDWLVRLFSVCLDHKADAVFGPVHGICPDDCPRWMIRDRFFDKQVPASGSRVDWRETRTSNTLVRGKWFYGDNAFRFDENLGRSGGSDTELFSRIERAGATFVSCQEALVTESIPANRATFLWLWNRWHRNGLIFEHICRNLGDAPHPVKRFFNRIGWMMIHTLSGIPGALLGNPGRCVQGLLKLSLGIGGICAWLRPQQTFKHVAYTGKAEDATYSDTKRIAFLTNIVSPYRMPVFEQLASTPGWDFQVFTDADSEFDRKWNSKPHGFAVKRTACISWKRTVRSRKPVPFKQIITLHFPIGLLKDLFAFRPQAVISLELGFRTAFAAIFCKLTGTPLVIWAYQSRISGTQGSWRNHWRRLLLSQASSVVGMGKQAREVLTGWGVPDHKIVDAPNAADHATLTERLSRSDTQFRANCIRERHAGGKHMAIVVGRLIPLKGISHILEAWRSLPEKLKHDWQLVFVGDGPLKTQILMEQEPSISVAGPVKPENMAFWYKAANLHIFPTCGDVWGLVVNEASACAIPSLCSIHAGCYDDLITDGQNGLAIDFTDPHLARETLARALSSDDLRLIGEAARKHISGFTAEKLASQFRDTAKSVMTA